MPRTKNENLVVNILEARDEKREKNGHLDIPKF